jgi:hypothetical protein
VNRAASRATTVSIPGCANGDALSVSSMLRTTKGIAGRVDRVDPTSVAHLKTNDHSRLVCALANGDVASPSSATPRRPTCP